MKAIAEVEVQALGVGVSQREEVAEAIRVLEEFGLKSRVNSLGTELEGDLERVFEAVRAVHERLHAFGAPRISTRIKIETRVDHQVELEDAISAVEGLVRDHEVSRTTLA